MSINPETPVENGELKSALPCCCLPGQCRGQVVDGKQPNGDLCKQEFAKSVWFEWHGTTGNLTPALAGNRFAIEWELNNGVRGNGVASDPHWTFAPENPIAVKRYRWTDPRVMLLDPYTGRLRHPIDIMQDPEGWKIKAPSSILPEPPQVETDPAKIEAAFAADEETDDIRRARMRIGTSPSDDQWRELGDALRLLDEASVRIRLPVDVFNCLKATAEATGQSLDEVVGEALRRDIEASFKANATEVHVKGIADLRDIDLSNMKLEPGQTVVVMGPDHAELVRRDEAALATLERMGYTYRGGEQWIPPLGMKPATTAPDLLDAAAGHMRDRAATYDKPEGERSMAATVQAFNAITGRDLRESEGWLLMAILKMVRSETRDTPHRDSVEDLIAYAGLYGEARIGGV